MKRILVVVCAIAALCSGVISSSAGAGAGVAGIEDCKELENRPDLIGIWCDDLNVFVNTIHWETWNKKHGVGDGFLHVNSCEPSCKSGTYSTYPVEVELYKKERTSCNGRDKVTFSRIRMEFEGAHPDYVELYNGVDLACAR